MSAFFPRTRAMSSSCDITASPRWRSTSHAASRARIGEDGILRVRRTGGRTIKVKSKKWKVESDFELTSPLSTFQLFHLCSVAHRLAVAAVSAHDRRLDQTWAVDVGAGRHREERVAGMLSHHREGRAGSGCVRRACGAHASSHGVADAPSELLFGHEPDDSVSTR